MIALSIAFSGAAGCDQLAPPLDELPLRDALRADPDVVAAMPDDARQRLGARLRLARDAEAGDETVAVDMAPDLLLARVDHGRELRGQDALISGVVTGGVVHPVAGSPDGAGLLPLPVPGGEGATAPTATLEAQGLAGDAGTAVRALLLASSARRLQRVVGWPAGAVAIGDTIYINAAWLVALAPISGDAGAGAATPAGAGVRATPRFQNDNAPGTPAPVDGGVADAGRPDASSVDGGQSDAGPSRSAPVDAGPPPPGYAQGRYDPPVWDAGTYYPPSTPPTSPTYPPASDGAACQGGCDTSTSGGGDDCSSSSDGGDDCESSSDDGAACDSSGDDGAACESSDDEGGCQVSRGRRRNRNGNGTLLSLVAPLAFLLPRRRT